MLDLVRDKLKENNMVIFTTSYNNPLKIKLQNQTAPSSFSSSHSSDTSFPFSSPFHFFSSFHTYTFGLPPSKSSPISFSSILFFSKPCRSSLICISRPPSVLFLLRRVERFSGADEFVPAKGRLQRRQVMYFFCIPSSFFLSWPIPHFPFLPWLSNVQTPFHCPISGGIVGGRRRVCSFLSFWNLVSIFYTFSTFDFSFWAI